MKCLVIFGFLTVYLTSQVCQDVLQSGYDADHFTIAVSLPVSLSLRSHSLNLYLEEKVSSFDVDQVIPIKQVRTLTNFVIFMSPFIAALVVSNLASRRVLGDN